MKKLVVIALGMLCAVPVMADAEMEAKIKASNDCVLQFLMAQGCHKSNNVKMECPEKGFKAMNVSYKNGYCRASMCASGKTVADETSAASRGHCKIAE